MSQRFYHWQCSVDSGSPDYCLNFYHFHFHPSPMIIPLIHFFLCEDMADDPDLIIECFIPGLIFQDDAVDNITNSMVAVYRTFCEHKSTVSSSLHGKCCGSQNFGDCFWNFSMAWVRQPMPPITHFLKNFSCPGPADQPGVSVLRWIKGVASPS